MKHRRKQQLRALAAKRPYQIVAGSAAALVLASGAGALLAHSDDAPVRQESAAAVAELAPRLGDVATRGQARIGASPSSASPSASATSAKPDPDLTRKAAPKPPSTKVLDYNYEAQTAYWNCGPAAVRNALSASGVETTQDAMVAPLGATVNGTNSAEDTTRGLNQMVKGSPYKTHEIPGQAATPAQMDQLQADVVNAITDGRGVVVNIAGSATDTDGGWHSFPGGHYIAVVGYKDDGRTVRIADSANPSYPSYWITTINLANWAATRGYSA
ncbi:Peptidase_C39 like family protein [Micromonospora rhizosphaerae]|uniref:glutathione gamma-glutamylcysteinyltransferase n=1 Tax=Micromonospora rhizosphaerae TaxID=568872 RepID=A0A1C6S2W2_9ACTN|nr:Peptidase_C39 like family protein [Micromonospora rhizosphaerae]